MKEWEKITLAQGVTFSAALLVGLGLSSIGNAAGTGPVAPSVPAAQSLPAAVPPDDELQSARQELGSAWDAGTSAEQRKKNATIGMMNAVNVALTALRKQLSDGVAQHTKDAADLASARAATTAKDAEIERLNNALAAEKRAEALRPNPALKAHPHAITNDKGVPLMLDLPAQSVPTKR
jgi:hypothetical protein